MKTRLLIIIGLIVAIAVFAISTSGAFTQLQSDLSECYYTDEKSIPQPCMIIDGWYDTLLQQSLQIEQENYCGEKYMIVGNNECVLNPEFVEPNTIIIYDVTENSGTRLSIVPHTMVMNLTGNDIVTFVNDDSTTVNIFDNSKGIWNFDDVQPSSQRTLIINGTGFYQFLVQNSREGETGEIVVLSENTNSLPVETRAKMAQSIISSDLRTRSELVSVGSGGAQPGITIGIHEKFQDKHDDDAEKFYHEKYSKMIPFDVPIRIEFRAPIMLQTG